MLKRQVRENTIYTGTMVNGFTGPGIRIWREKFRLFFYYLLNKGVFIDFVNNIEEIHSVCE